MTFDAWTDVRCQPCNDMAHADCTRDTGPHPCQCPCQQLVELQALIGDFVDGILDKERTDE